MVATTTEEKRVMRYKSWPCKKRKECIMKKTMELSVLCDVKACAVVLGPNGQIETWPENPDIVREIIKMYQDLSTKNGCKNKRVFEASVKVENPDDHVRQTMKINEDFGMKEGRRKQQEAALDSKLETLEKKRVFETSVKVEKPDDHVPETMQINEDFGTKEGCIKQQEAAWDSKLETLEKKADLLNENKGKEVAVFDGEEAELNLKYFTDLRNFLEVELSDSQGIQIPPIEPVPEQSIPCLETMSNQNLFENPQFCSNSLDNSGMGFLEGTPTDHGNVQNIPLQFNFINTCPPDHGINFFQEKSDMGLNQIIQFPDQSLGFDSNTCETTMLNVMPTGMYPQLLQDATSFSGKTLMHPTRMLGEMPTAMYPQLLRDGMSFSAMYPQLLQDGMSFSGGTLMQPTMHTPYAGQTIFGNMPQLYPLPQQAFGPLIYQPSSSSSLQHHNM